MRSLKDSLRSGHSYPASQANMFGGNVASSWGAPQQNQPQQQQQPGAFGQPAGFGASAFGSAGTGTFGQQPAQQPQANPMFGNLGGTTTQSTGTGFGTFGAPAPTSQSSTTNPMFGATKQAGGFGGFGGGSTFGGGGGAFGQSTSTPSGSGATGVFGHPTATTSSAFGSGTGVFGGNKPATTFGSTTGGAPSNVPPVTTGSSNPPYSVYQEKDNNTMGMYQAISCMPAYAGTSHEEIRLQDYNQGRKTAGAFGQSAAFGTAQPTTSIFGAQPPQQPSAFGGTTTTGGFGAFGAPATNPTAPAATTGLFGGGAFGQPQQQQQPQQTSTFGAFGAPAQPQQQQTGGLFGGTFGSTAAKPAGFGTFGGGTTGTSTFGGGGTFGQPQQQQQQPQQPTGGLFGSTQTQAPTGFGGFGTTGTKSIFGGTQPATTQPATTGFGGFGSAPQQPQQPQAQQPSLFGGGTGLFGGSTQQQQQQPQTTQPATTSLFGGGTTGQTSGTGLFGGSLFGGAGQQQQQQQQPGQTGGFGGLFGGSKPAAPAGQSLFGGFGQQPANQPQQSLFGSTLGQPTAQPSTLGGGLFGAKPAAPPLGMSTSMGQGGLFGASTPSGGLFSTTINAPGAQGSLTASISQPIGADLPIFDILPPGPRLVNLEASQPKKKAGFFVDIPTRSPVPRVQLGYTPANSKLRGFGSSTSISSAAGVNPFAASLSSSTKSHALALSRVTDNKTPTGPDGFLLGRSASPSLGSGGRQSVKKVILDKKVDPSELFIKSGGSPGLRGSKVIFSPALSAAVREKEMQASLNTPSKGAESPTPAPRPQRTPNRFTAQSTQQPLTDDGQDHGTPELEEGDYWVKPDLATLKQTGYDQLSSFKDLKVGRVGYGEIHFLESVDLTGLSKLGALLGEVVRFDEKECSVYPDSEDVDKPPPGSGLNVRAKLSLLHCWAADKATREPIKDEKHPTAVKHLKRLRNMKDTHFESFDFADGKWTFTVDHF
ncbi:hypothetical protein Hypma_012839 [Hypsizygus marmoreus]|uniref:Peptidase S59 domain-containing protein n=1 Tax=Hypsizygus marmoreus TaxID=39966 RepID=A0A369JG06_HYPMA|nr:hypothetical protein Hypma_012839 [Hypsizygus marmoreus]